MSFETAIKIENIAKCYEIYEKPSHRLKQFILPILQKILRITVRKYCSDFWAIRGVSFEIKRGETYGIIGRNGAGKSTLLQLISGTLNPTHGAISVNGRVAALLELGAAFNPDFTGRENIEITTSIYGITGTELNQRINSILKFADIGEFIDRPVKTYSSGMYVRLAFSVIANVDADILIIDEALAVGDARFQQKCVRFLRDFKDKGGTLLFVSHDTAMVMALCEKVLYLNRIGNETISQSGLADEMCSAYLRDIYSDQQPIQLPDELNENKSAVCAEDQFSDSGFEIENTVCADGDESLVSVGDFKNNTDSFGDGGGSILNAYFQCKNHKKQKSLKTGDNVSLIIELKANKNIKLPVITVILKDRSGQFLFLDGSVDAYKGCDISLPNGKQATVCLEFIFPSLIEGFYSIDISFADGSHMDHTTMHWIYDVLELRVSKGRNVSGISGFSKLKLKWVNHE